MGWVRNPPARTIAEARSRLLRRLDWAHVWPIRWLLLAISRGSASSRRSTPWFRQRDHRVSPSGVLSTAAPGIINMVLSVAALAAHVNKSVTSSNPVVLLWNGKGMSHRILHPFRDS